MLPSALNRNLRWLPVVISASSEIHDYLRFADALLVVPNMQARVRRELQDWRFKRANLGGVVSESETPRLFVNSGSSLVRDTLKEAWDHFLRPAQLNGAIFSVDDLQSIRSVGKADLAVTLRNQFQSLGIEGMNYSLCFSANPDYFAETKGPTDSAPRFYTKLLLEPFTVEETSEYVRSVFGLPLDTTAIIAAWLRGETLGHPYFIAFVCRHLTEIESEIQPDKLETIWPAIFDQLPREKFRPDISQLSAKELDLINRLTSLGTGEFRASQFGGKFQREYFARLVEKRLLIRTKRGRYKLYHPLFREFLRQTR